MNLVLILIKNGQAYDISQLVQKILWKGRKGSAARSLEATLIDTDDCKTGIDVTKGDSVIFSYGGEERFRGIIMSQSQSEDNVMHFTAYDNGIYLANNRDTFVYENKTVHDIFLDICRRYELKYDKIAVTSYKIPKLNKSKTTAWDAVLDAVSQDHKATGAKYYVRSDKGKLSLIKRSENILQYAFETDKNIFSYDFKKSIEKIKTRIKVLAKEDTVWATEKNTELEKKIGIFSDVESKDEDLSDAKLKAQIKQNLKKASSPEICLNIETFGTPEVISGAGVWVFIDKLGLRRTFWVDEDTHTFEGDTHTMSLKLNQANLAESEV